MHEKETAPLIPAKFPEPSTRRFYFNLGLSGMILSAKMITAAGFTIFSIRLYNLPTAATVPISIAAVVSEIVVNFNKFPGIYQSFISQDFKDELPNLASGGKLFQTFSQVVIALSTAAAFFINFYATNHSVRYILNLAEPSPEFWALLKSIMQPSRATLAFYFSGLVSLINVIVYLTFNARAGNQNSHNIGYYIDNFREALRGKLAQRYAAFLLMAGLQVFSSTLMSKETTPRAAEFLVGEAWAHSGWMQAIIMVSYFVGGASGVLNRIPHIVTREYYRKIVRNIKAITNKYLRGGTISLIVLNLGIYTAFCMFAATAGNLKQFESTFNLDFWFSLMLGMLFAIGGNVSFALFQIENLVKFFANLAMKFNDNNQVESSDFLIRYEDSKMEQNTLRTAEYRNQVKPKEEPVARPQSWWDVLTGEHYRRAEWKNKLDAQKAMEQRMRFFNVPSNSDSEEDKNDKTADVKVARDHSNFNL